MTIVQQLFKSNLKLDFPPHTLSVMPEIKNTIFYKTTNIEYLDVPNASSTEEAHNLFNFEIVCEKNIPFLYIIKTKTNLTYLFSQGIVFKQANVPIPRQRCLIKQRHPDLIILSNESKTMEVVAKEYRIEVRT